MPTDRQRLIEALESDWMTAYDLSAEVGLSVKDVLSHLPHVKKSIRPPQKFLTDPARCLACGYVFQDRRKQKRPGKCPKCRDERISEPRFRIE